MNWYVLKTKSNQEYIAENHLKESSVEYFLPRAVHYRRKSQDFRKLDRPMFPGYVFVRPSATQLQSMSYVRGTCGLISFNARPAVVTRNVVEEIRAMMDSHHQVDVRNGFQLGTKVKLIVGDFREIEGELVRYASSYRLVVNVLVLHKSISIEVDARLAESTPNGLRIPVLRR